MRTCTVLFSFATILQAQSSRVLRYHLFKDVLSFQERDVILHDIAAYC